MLDVRAGESVFLTWDTHRQTVDGARGIAEQIRRRGGKIIGCTLDPMVRRDALCPVCACRGLKGRA